MKKKSKLGGARERSGRPKEWDNPASLQVTVEEPVKRLLRRWCEENAVRNKTVFGPSAGRSRPLTAGVVVQEALKEYFRARGFE